MSEHDDTRDVFIDAEALAEDVAAPGEGGEQPRDDETTRDVKNAVADDENEEDNGRNSDP